MPGPWQWPRPPAKTGLPTKRDWRRGRCARTGRWRRRSGGRSGSKTAGGAAPYGQVGGRLGVPGVQRPLQVSVDGPIKGRGHTTGVAAGVVVVEPVCGRDLVEVGKPAPLGQLVHEVEVVGPLDGWVHTTDRSHRVAAGHQRIDRGPVPARVDGVTSRRSLGPTVLANFLSYPVTTSKAV